MDLSDLRTFLQVVELGSLQRAAAARRVSRNVIRRQLDHLERALDVELLLRGARGVELTAAGVEVVDGATRLLTDASMLVERAKAASDDARGVLRFIVPAGMPTHPRARALGALRAHYPELDVEVVEAEDPLELIGAPFDLLLHFGDAPQLEGWFSQVLLRAPAQLVATPAYLEAHGEPTSVADLGAHRLLQWSSPQEGAQGLPLRRGGFVQTRPWLRTANLSLLLEVVLDDAGLLYAPVIPAVFGGGAEALVPILKRTVGRTITLRALSPRSSRTDPRIRAMLKNARRLMAAAAG